MKIQQKFPPVILFWYENCYLALREVNVGLQGVRAVQPYSSQFLSCCATAATGTGAGIIVFFNRKDTRIKFLSLEIINNIKLKDKHTIQIECLRPSCSVGRMTYTITTPLKLNSTKTPYAFRHSYREARYVCLHGVTVVFCNTHKHTCTTPNCADIYKHTCINRCYYAVLQHGGSALHANKFKI